MKNDFILFSRGTGKTFIQQCLSCEFVNECNKGRVVKWGMSSRFEYDAPKSGLQIDWRKEND